MAVANALGDQPAQGCSGGGDHGVHPNRCGGSAGSDRRTGIETEPAEPQQASAEHDQRQVVRPHRIALPAQPLAQDDGKRETGRTGVDVDSCATCEVDRLQVVGDPAADVLAGGEVEHPVGDREVDDSSPDNGEDHPGAELGAIGNCAGDQSDGDDREHGLERDERHHRVDTGLIVEGDLAGRPHEALETQVLNGIAEQAVADVVSEGS